MIGVVACPATGEALRYDAIATRLVADQAGLSYPVHAGIPILLTSRKRDRDSQSVRHRENAGFVEDPAVFAPRYDATINSKVMRAMFGDSGYFNLGYWPPGVTTLVQACDRMVDELALAISPRAAVILDVGCGLGAGTRRLAQRFPQALVIGANVSLHQLMRARARGVAACVVTDAARLGIATASADAVVACESAQHFNTRADFFAEAFRVLRPGGSIVLADIIFRTLEPVGTWTLPPENHAMTVEDYGELLSTTGFTDVTVRDVTELTWRPFWRLMAMHPEGLKDRDRAIENSIAHYVIASARKAE